jgi:hypothetical protein
MAPRSLLHRDLRSAQHVDLLVVAAVCTVLVIRFVLRLTNYPQVGGDRLHVAHMLWGGLLMLAALLLLLSFLGRRSRLWAALVGGVGFGLFIDEVGKFVTNDNDYFYRPAVALIYVTFVLTYLAVRGLRRRHKVTREEYLVNALHELEEAVVHDLQADERTRVLQYLAPIAARDQLAAGLVAVLHDAALAPVRPPGLVDRLRAAAAAGYRRLATHPAFGRALVAFFVAQLALKLVTVAVLAVRSDSARTLAARLALLSWSGDTLALAEWLQIASSLASALLVAVGVALLGRSRERALRMFHRSILVSIFLTQVFMFYREQWAALLVLAFNVAVLVALNFVREHEAGHGR